MLMVSEGVQASCQYHSPRVFLDSARTACKQTAAWAADPHQQPVTVSRGLLRGCCCRLCGLYIYIPHSNRTPTTTDSRRLAGTKRMRA